MAGTVEGGKRAAKLNKEKYGADFYQRIGRKGGRNSNNGGFAYNADCDGLCGFTERLGSSHKVQQCAGAKGGLKSKRTKRAN